jgi:hypothetical protein
LSPFAAEIADQNGGSQYPGGGAMEFGTNAYGWSAQDLLFTSLATAVSGSIGATTTCQNAFLRKRHTDKASQVAC